MAKARVVTCGLCFEVLTDPVTLPCGHSFDQRCLRTKLDGGGVGDGLTCPLCNVHHPGVTGDTLAQHADPELAAAIDRMARGEEDPRLCQWCEDATAELYCHECQYVLCRECNVAVHKNKAKRAHQAEPVEDSKALKSMTRKCSERGHEEYRLEFFCQQCASLCCAYCLQLGPHRQHDSVLVSKAAADVRQQMGRDLETLGQVKARIETKANELNRVHSQYLETYDHVESLVHDRFNAFRQQLLQREVEVRKMLQNLRDVGDTSLAEARLATLQHLDSVNEAGMSFRRLQHGGADAEVLEHRTAMHHFATLEVPQMQGSGFRLSDLGDIQLTGFNLTLDLVSAARRTGSAAAIEPPLMADPPRLSRSASEVSLRSKPRPPLRFTFAPEPEVQMTDGGDGNTMHCSARTRRQVGIRARESFETLRPFWRADDGTVSWRVRLDTVRDTFCGVLDTDPRSPTQDGFYWRPMHTADYDGGVGQPTAALRGLPKCRPGDVVTFSYDTAQRSLRVAINGKEYGPIVNELPALVAPCFVFAPGESLTVLR